MLVRFWPVVAILGLSTVAGCARLNLRGDGYDDDDWGKSVQQDRPADDSKELWGFDARSRDIERDLGVR